MELREEIIPNSQGHLLLPLLLLISVLPECARNIIVQQWRNLLN